MTLKPLAQRKCDIFPLIEAFTKGGKRLAFEPEAKDCVLEHAWPGNTRELRRFVELVSAGAHGPVTLDITHKHIKPSPTPHTAAPEAAGQGDYEYAVKNGLNAAVDRFIGGLISRSLAENHGKRAATLAQLKISKRLLYATLARTRNARGG